MKNCFNGTVIISNSQKTVTQEAIAPVEQTIRSIWLYDRRGLEETVPQSLAMQ